MKMQISRYCVETPLGHGKVAIYSTLTKAFIVLEDALWQAAKRNVHQLGDDVQQELEKLGLIIPITTNERNLYLYFRYKLSHYFGKLVFTILPTLDCNMTCVYCFQRGIRTSWAGNAKCNVNGITNFVNVIVSEYQPRELFLSYFGGEPLLNFETLAVISRSIQDNLPEEVYVPQAVITNGTLLKSYASALREIGVTTVQVTLDGPPEVHDQRRTFPGGRGSFGVIFEGIQAAIKAGIFVVVQMNIDTQNYRSVHRLAELLKREFPLTSSIALNLGEVTRPNWHCLHAAQYVADLQTMGHVWVDAIEAAVDSGLPVGDFLVNWPCPRECDYEYIISPTGEIYKCISGVGEEVFKVGCVEDPPFVLQRECARFVTWSSIEDDRCAYCPYLPECGGGCRYRAWVEQKDVSAVQCEREFYDTAIPGVLKAYSRTRQVGTMLRVRRDASSAETSL